MPSPEHVTPSVQHSLVAQLLDQDSPEIMARVKSEMYAPLSSINEPTGKAIGFFEQGLLTGGAVAVVSAIALGTLIVRFAGPVIVFGHA